MEVDVQERKQHKTTEKLAGMKEGCESSRPLKVPRNIIIEPKAMAKRVVMIRSEMIINWVGLSSHYHVGELAV